MPTRPAEVDEVVLAFVTANPGRTAREVGEMLGDARSKSPERSRANASLARLRDRGLVKCEGFPQRYTAAVATQSEADAEREEYVDLVLHRLGYLHKEVPERLRWTVECCMVDLERAIGRRNAEGRMVVTS